MARSLKLSDTAPSLATLRAEETAAHIRSGFTPRDRFRVGIEVESFCHTRWGTRCAYRGGTNSMERVLLGLARRLWGIAEYEAGDVIGVKSLLGNLSLEPGCQLEWSSHPYSTLNELLLAKRRWHQLRDLTLEQHDLHLSMRRFDDSSLPMAPWPRQKRDEQLARKWLNWAIVAGVLVSLLILTLAILAVK